MSDSKHAPGLPTLLRRLPWVILLLTFVAPSWAQVRYGNLVNERWATISSGPQSALIVDVPRGAGDAEARDRVTRAARREWANRAQAMQAQVGALRRAGVLAPRGVLPISTIVMARKQGRLVLPPLQRNKGRAVGGDTQLTFRFTGFTPEDINFLRRFLDLAYPRVEGIYGKPAVSGEVEVVNAGPLDSSTVSEVTRLAFGSYDATNNRILLPIYENLDSFAHAFLLNLVHAFHGPAVFQYDAWEQGFARATAAIVARDPVFGFQDASANTFYSLLRFYDLLNQPALGNSTFFPPSQADLPIDGQFTIGKMIYPRLGMSGAAWLKVYIENQSFFRQFNEAYYARFTPGEQPSLAGNIPELRGIAGQFLPQGVEGIDWDAWYPRQYVLDTSISPGNKLYAFVVPSDNDPENGQSAAFTLVYYRSEARQSGGGLVGDEILLNGRAYATYFDQDNARINLGIAAEQAAIENGEGFITTLAFPQQGQDAGRITCDFNVGNATARTYFASGFQGDFQAVLLGRGREGSVTVTQTTLPPVQTRTKTTTIEGSAFAVALGTGPNDLAKTVVTVTNGDLQRTFTLNTGDGLYWTVLREGQDAGGVITLSRTFNRNTLPYLVTFPLRPLPSALPEALGLPATDFLLSYWNATAQPRPAYETLNPNQPSISPVQPGRGYWLKVFPADFSVNARAVSITGIAPPDDTDFTVPCVYGWNMIGYPFPTFVRLKDILVQYLQNDAITWDDAVARGLVSGDVYTTDPTGNYTTAPDSSMNGEQWQGYWVRVLAPTGVTLLMPGPQSPTARSRATRASSSLLTRGVHPSGAPRPEWSVQVTARQEGQPDSAATFGAAKGATRAFDTLLDRELPPAVVPTLSLEFSQADGTKATGGRNVGDFRGEEAIRGREKWALNVATPRSGPVTLTWDNLGTVSRSVRLVLVDKTDGSRVALRNRSSYTFTGEAGKSRAFELLTEPALSRPLAITNLTALSTRSGRSRGVRVGYALTGDAEVSVDLHALGGKLIRRIGSGRAQEAGQQTIHWDGRAENGSALPAGPYTIHVTARGEDGATVRQTRTVMLLN